ncbi:lipase 1-like isoform X2 [Aethina tumida]|uniref:lipase 1-like isoform X2 n=1 Tax=Aethina tumida TaxID=116153 RepID=UPI002147B5A6|nr:lipase 1-like isoform X2 [Aethina tumida]
MHFRNILIRPPYNFKYFLDRIMYTRLFIILPIILQCLSQEPSDADLTILQQFTKYGYESEQHEIETEDGYILTVYRVLPKIKREQKPLPVLLVHGLLGSAENYVIAGPKRGLAYMLSDLGYDVWLQNCRGSWHSRKHRSLNPNRSKQFWQFSWHEIGKYDHPAVIDHMLVTTNSEQVFYVGHSQGCTSFYVMLSERPEYQTKIKLGISLAPAVFMKHFAQPLLRPFVSIYDTNLLDALNQYEFVPFINNSTLRRALLALCKREMMKEFCMGTLTLIFGNIEQFDYNLYPTIFGQVPAGSSTNQIYHYAQGIISEKFRQFDFGTAKNMKLYNSPTPPHYHLNNISTPIALFYSHGDQLAVAEDILHLGTQLPNVLEIYEVSYHNFTHFDFIMAKDIVKLCNKRVVELIENAQNDV